MKKALVTVLLAVWFIIPFSTHAAEFVIPKSFEFLAVDGKDLDPGVLAWNRGKSMDLSPGLHRIAIKFYEVVPDRDNPMVEEFLNSEPILITMQVEANKRYQLIPHPDMKKNMYAYAENPRLKIVDQSGQKVSYELSVLGDPREQQTLSQKMTLPSGAAMPVEPVNDVTRATLPQRAAQAPVNSAAPAASMLQYWWSQADAQTRSEFMKWVYSQ